MKPWVITLSVSFLALVAGIFLGAKYIGKGEVVIALCVMGDVATNDGFLTTEQFRLLSESTGKKIKSDYPLLANSIALSDEAADMASPDSNCSQILVSLTKGMR